MSRGKKSASQWQRLKFGEIRQKVAPFIPSLRLHVRRQRKIRHERRPLWLPSQLHVRLLWSLVCLLKVAPTATSHQVVPSVRTTRPTRNYMVNRHLLRFYAAILTNMVISSQHRMSRQTQLRVRTPNQILHAQHRRRINLTMSRQDWLVPLNQNIRLAKHQ